MSGEFRAVHYSIQTDKPGASFRTVHLSDLHLMEHGPGNCALIRACAAEKPDIILLTGDLVNSKMETEADLMPALELVRGICGIAHVYAANGNHESQLRRKSPGLYKVYNEAIKAAGVIVLNNKSANARIRGRKLRITGLELPHTAYKKLRKLHFGLDDMVSKVGEAPIDEANAPYQILLAHSPAFAESYAAWGSDLTLCGHYHGGVMRLWGNKILISPYGMPFPRYGYGHFDLGGRHVIVTSGLGEHTVPVRIHNPMEIAVIDIKESEACLKLS